MAPQIPGARKLQMPKTNAFQKVERYHVAVEELISEDTMKGERQQKNDSTHACELFSKHRHHWDYRAIGLRGFQNFFRLRSSYLF